MVVAQEKIAARIGADVLQARRQCGRCGGRHRLCDGGDLSARRKYRRRRLHGDPFGASAARTSRSTIARPRRPRPRRDIFLGPDGKPDNAKSRDSALGIGVPGTVAGLALALEKYGSGKFTLARAAAAGDRRWRATALSSPTTCADTLPDGSPAAGALAGVGENILPRRRHVAARGRHAGPDRSGGDAHGDRRTGAARILSGAGRGKTREGDPRRRRHHDARTI